MKSKSKVLKFQCNVKTWGGCSCCSVVMTLCRLQQAMWHGRGYSRCSMECQSSIRSDTASYAQTLLVRFVEDVLCNSCTTAVVVQFTLQIEPMEYKHYTAQRAGCTDRMWRGLCGKDLIHLNCSSGLDEPHQLWHNYHSHSHWFTIMSYKPNITLQPCWKLQQMI